MSFLDNVLQLCEQNGEKLTPLMKKLNLSPGNVQRWRNGATVNSDILMKFSDHFKVSVDFLLNGEEYLDSDECEESCPSTEEKHVFWDNFKRECKKRGLKPTPVLKKCGIGTGNIGRWQTGSSPNADAVIAIARYLNCSTDSLLTGSELQNDALVCVDDNERNLIIMFREIPDSIRNFVYNSVKTAYDSEMARRETQERLLG